MECVVGGLIENRQQVERMASLRWRWFCHINVISNFENIAGNLVPIATAVEEGRTSEQTVMQKLSIP